MAAKKDAKEEAKRLADMAGVGLVFEGETVKMVDVEGEDIVVLDFVLIDSQYREGEKFLSLQVEIKGEKAILNTNAGVILRTFREKVTKEMLPAPVRFVKVMSKSSGKEYWTME